MNANGKEETIPEIFRDRERIQRAVTEAVRDAVRTHKLLGQSIVACRDGKVIVIPPEEIKLPGDTNGDAKP